jgi:hypothetical protein
MSASECVPSASDALTERPAIQCVCASRPKGTHSLDAVAVVAKRETYQQNPDALERLRRRLEWEEAEAALPRRKRRPAGTLNARKRRKETQR